MSEQAKITTSASIDPREDIDVFNILDKSYNVKYSVPNTEYKDINYNIEETECSFWFHIPKEIKRDVEDEEFDLFPYRVSKDVWILESSVNHNYNIGYRGEVKLRKNDMCKDCGGPVEINYVVDISQVVNSECICCKKSQYKLSIDDFKPN